MNDIQEKYKNERLLIISNNPLSTTRNNGKTLLSYFDDLPKDSVYQLYFEQSSPTVEGYKYFRLSDRDIINGILSRKKRGGVAEAVPPKPANTSSAGRSTKHKGAFARLLRDILWLGKWRSPQLLSWLDEIKPTAIFYVGGDAGFAYNICEFVQKRYNCRLTLYITDDYIMPRTAEGFWSKVRRKQILKKARKCVARADAFVTVSEPMRALYAKVLGKDSFVAVNMTEPMRMEDVKPSGNGYSLIYAGSLYYGRDLMLGKIARAIEKYNATADKKARLNIYTNTKPNDETRARFEIEGCCSYEGSLDKEQLRLELNKSDILVFVESFDKLQIEKTKLSLSTKVPEYLSVGRPIFAVGPCGIGSMDYLADAAICVNDEGSIETELDRLLRNAVLQNKLAETAKCKYEALHDKSTVQKNFLKNVLGR